MARWRNTLRCRTFNLGFFLHDRKRLVGQWMRLQVVSQCDQVTHNIVIAIVEGRGIGHAPIHYPALALVLGPNKVLNFPVPLGTISILPPVMYGWCDQTHASEGTWPGASFDSQYLCSVSTSRALSIVAHELVGSSIAPFQHTLKLFIGPGIQINRLDPTNMRAHAAVNTRTPDTNEDTQVP